MGLLSLEENDTAKLCRCTVRWQCPLSVVCASLTDHFEFVKPIDHPVLKRFKSILQKA